MKIVSGKTGTPHVTSEQFRQIIEGTVGQGSYILTSGENLEPELASNNMLKIRGGMMSHHGNVSCVELNTYDEVTLTNGSQGVKRIDLVVNRYTRNDETGLEKNEWIVIIGTPDASSPKVPQHTIGNLRNGDLIDDCPVFEVHYDGINVTEVKKLLPVMDNLESLNGNSYKLYTGLLGGISTRPYVLKKYNDGTFELCGNLDVSNVRLKYSNSSKVYFTTISDPIPEELTIDLDKRVQFAGSAESSGIYFLTLNELTTTTLTAYLSAMNYTSEIAYIASGFVLKGWWK